MTINGNIFSNLHGEFWMLLANENTPRQVSKAAYENVIHGSLTIESMTPEQLDQAFWWGGGPRPLPGDSDGDRDEFHPGGASHLVRGRVDRQRGGLVPSRNR
jgi:hypothetical protein